VTVEIAAEADETPDEPVHYNECIEKVGTALARDGAMGVILIDGAPLERIERSYGVQAHRKAADMLRKLVREACRQDLAEHDLLVGGSSSPDELAIFFLRPRSDDRFYRERLPELTRRLIEHIAANGQKIVYPYDRDAPHLPIGHATVFHNPGLGPERQILEAFEHARRDAQLNGTRSSRTSCSPKTWRSSTSPSSTSRRARSSVTRPWSGVPGRVSSTRRTDSSSSPRRPGSSSSSTVSVAAPPCAVRADSKPVASSS